MIARSSRIAGFGHAVPPRIVRNAEIEIRLGLESGWIERRTGIRLRRWASDDETLTGLASNAGRMAVEDAGISSNDIGLTLLATSTPDHLLPPSAPLLAYRLGLPNSGAIDLAGACSGFIYAMTLADAFVRAQGKSVLVVAANILSRRINHADRSTSALFADGAGAVVLVPCNDESIGLKASSLISDGSGYDLISIDTSLPRSVGNPPVMTMKDGRAVFTRAVELMTQTSQKVMEQTGVAPAEIQRFIPHQANLRLCEAVRENLGIDGTRTVSTIADYGNSSAATIPLSLSLENRRNPFKSGEQILMTAAGAGLIAGSIILTV